MKIAWRLVAILLVAGAVGSLFAGYLVFRNAFADQFSGILTGRADDLTSLQANAMEQKLKTDPDDFADRIELLEFYSDKSANGGLTPADLSNRRAHILWTIQHQPSSKFAGDPAASFLAEDGSADPDGTRKAGALWLQQVAAHPSNSRILANAGQFFFRSGNLQQSESLLERAHAITPHSFQISSALAIDYWQNANAAPTASQRHDLAVQAMDASEDALDLAHGAGQRRLVLPDGARAAYESGAFNRAEMWAYEMLADANGYQNDRNYADEIHYGNIVLGLLALQKNDLKGAGDHLVAAADIAGNPRIDTLGPNMMLARELLRKHDRKPVLKYLDACGKFWKSGDKKLKRWRSEVIAGVMPDFGANLNY